MRSASRDRGSAASVPATESTTDPSPRSHQPGGTRFGSRAAGRGHLGTGGGGARPARRAPDQRRDRREAVHFRAYRRKPRLVVAAQAGGAGPAGSGPGGGRARKAGRGGRDQGGA